MVADPPTKVMLSGILYDLIKLGSWRTFNHGTHLVIVAPALQVAPQEVTEGFSGAAGIVWFDMLLDAGQQRGAVASALDSANHNHALLRLAL